jgi:hypothetical protein
LLSDDEKTNCLVLIILRELDNNRYTKKKEKKRFACGLRPASLLP